MIVPGGFLLLSTPLAQPAAGRRPPADTDRWRDGDVEGAATLLHDAYPPEIGQHFALNGTLREWLGYVTALVEQSACGTFDPRLTRVVRDDRGLQGVALTTLAAPSTAHLAQLAVRSDSRRMGVASALVTDVAARAAAVGCAQLTLLVAATNIPARRLYESLGFIQVST